MSPASSSGARCRQAGRRGKRVAGLEPAAYGGVKDVSAAWPAGVLAGGAWPAAGAEPAGWGRPEDLQERWEERAAIMVYDGRLPPTEGG